MILNLTSAEWVTPARFCELTGLTVRAIEGKRRRDVWHEGVHFKWVDGGLYYSLSAYNEWVAKAPLRASKETGVRSVSASPSKVSLAVNR